MKTPEIFGVIYRAAKAGQWETVQEELVKLEAKLEEGLEKESKIYIEDSKITI